jgi:short-subunit dehydrogenase
MPSGWPQGLSLILVAHRADRLQALSDKIASARGRKVEIVEADLRKGC